MTSHTRPAFITFTGADRAGHVEGMRALAARYPVEWGILVDPARSGQPLFPAGEDLWALQHCGLRLSAHVCGAPAKAIVETAGCGLDLSGFSRVQVNHGFDGSNGREVENASRFGAARGLRAALQCQGEFPPDGRVDWLFDVSFGKGRAPTAWPAVRHYAPLCGLSGGLNAGNVASVLASLDVGPGLPYWIDMESGVRTGGLFDLDACAAVCVAVYGQGGNNGLE